MQISKFLKVWFFMLPIGALTPIGLQAEGGDDDDGSKTYVISDTIRVIGERYVKIPEINSVALKMPLDIQSTPASVGVVTRGVFRNQDAIVVSDALKNISGINIQSQFGVADYFLIRGFDSLTSGLILTDGAAEPEVSFYNLYNINRVETLKGPGAFLYGANPLSGAVNMSRKQPIFRNFLNASGSYGKFNSYRGTADIGLVLPNSNLAFRMNGLWQGSDNYRDNKDNESYAINPALTWQFSDRGSLTANFEYVNSDYRPDSGLPLQFIFGQTGQVENIQIPDVPRTRSYQSPYDYSDQKITRVRLDYNQVFSDHITLRDKFYFTELDWLTDGTLLFGAFPSDNQGNYAVSRVLQSLDDAQKFMGNQLEAVLGFNTGSVGHRMLTGFEFARNTDDFQLQVAPLPSLDLINPVETAPPRDQLFQLPLATVDARSLIFAPYIVDQVSFSNKFQVMAGGRYDVINSDDSRIEYDQATFQPSVIETKRNYNKFSPMVGALVAPTETVSIYANYGQSFAPPSTLVSGTPKPEESTQFEVGTRTRMLDGRLSGSLAVYSLKKENIGIPDETGILREDGDQRSRGVEFEISAQPVTGWFTFLAYAFTDAELTRFTESVQISAQQSMTVDRSGNTAPFAPEHVLNFWTAKDFSNGIGLGGGVRYSSGQFISADNQFEISGYLTLDAFVSYSFSNFRWSVNVKNFNGKAYETRGFGSTAVTPANPFAAYTALEISL